MFVHPLSTMDAVLANNTSSSNNAQPTSTATAAGNNNNAAAATSSSTNTAATAPQAADIAAHPIARKVAKKCKSYHMYKYRQPKQHTICFTRNNINQSESE